jgi:PAS domain S-box-containing protein
MNKLTIFHSSLSRWNDLQERERKMNTPNPPQHPLIWWAESEEMLSAKLSQIVFLPHNIAIVAGFETTAGRISPLITAPGFSPEPVAPGTSVSLRPGHVYYTPGRGVFSLSGNKLSVASPEPAVHTDEFFRALVMCTTDVIQVIDTAGRIVFETPSVANLLGYAPGEMMGKAIAGFVHPEDAGVIASHFSMPAVDGQPCHPAEIRLLHKDGSWVWVESSGVVVDTDPLIRGTVVSFRDISARRAATDEARELNITLVRRANELVESNEELERFAYIASHDLQEPLRMITSFLLLLKKRYTGQVDDTAAQYIDFAVDGAERMKKLIRDLLEYSRAGAPLEDYTQVDLNMVMFDVATMFDNKITSAGARLDVGHLPMIQGRRLQLQQLFQNLVSNALKYRGKEPPVIEIGCVDKGKHWEFFVKDNGIGIDPRFNEKIFLIFQRLHNKTEYSGTGIGLAICRKIVERHGGQIWVESEPGKGSTFKFTLVK